MNFTPLRFEDQLTGYESIGQTHVTHRDATFPTGSPRQLPVSLPVRVLSTAPSAIRQAGRLLLIERMDVANFAYPQW